MVNTNNVKPMYTQVKRRTKFKIQVKLRRIYALGCFESTTCRVFQKKNIIMNLENRQQKHRYKNIIF